MQRGQQRTAGETGADQGESMGRGEAGLKEKTAEYVGELSNMMLGVLRSVKQDMQNRRGEPEEASKLRHSEQSALIAICGCCIEQNGAENARGQGIRTSQISEALDLAPSTVTPLLDALEEQGLLERRRTREDRRVVQVYPTEKGWEMAEYFRGRNEEHLSDMLRWLGEEDCTRLLQIFRRIAAYYSAENRP